MVQRWLVTVSLLVGCYDPRIADRLRCSATPGQDCPVGFSCERSSGYCRRHPNNDAGPGGIGGRAGGGGGAGGRGGAGVGGQGGGSKQTQEFCTVFNQGLATQTDDCAPGLVCLEDGCDSRCYKVCSGDGDCANSACDRDVGGGQKVCDVPFAACNPVGATSGCTGSTVCYLSSSHPDRTVCDCPFDAKGSNADCTRSRDCIRGLACADPGNGRSRCLQTCLLANGGADCPSGEGSCHPYRGAPAGSTNDTFGYCF